MGKCYTQFGKETTSYNKEKCHKFCNYQELPGKKEASECINHEAACDAEEDEHIQLSNG